MPSEKYRLVCILDAISDGFDNKSSMDVSPDYLHIHILKTSYLRPITELIELCENVESESVIYQWGIPFEKLSKVRSAKVSCEEVIKRGNVGIGSFAIGAAENKKDFIGGGEAFMSGSQNFRISKGNRVFESSAKQSYWTFQAADFGGSQRVDDIRGLVVNGRQNLMLLLKAKSGDKPFVATFDAEFEGDFFVRSNGIFPEDTGLVEDPEKFLFCNDAEGGHLVGGSDDNLGDLDSLGGISSSDFCIKILSPVLIKPINEVRISKKNGEFRPPRAEIEVKQAAQLIQRKWREHK